MSLKKIFTQGLVALATLGIVMPAPQEVMAATTQATPLVRDVALSTGGTLRGQVLSQQGTPAANAAVAIEGQGIIQKQTTTDQNGEFAVSGLQGGVYVVHAAGSSTIYRVWAEGTAPPHAAQGTLIVADGSSVRGELGQHMGLIGVGGLLVLGAGGAIIALAARDRDAS